MLWKKRAGSGNRARQKGFTLTELMVALVILGLIMSVVYRVFSSQERFFRTQEQVSAMQENLRATMEYINQELSWLGYNVPGVAVVKAAPYDLIFKANIPNTGQTIQYVRYVFEPSTNTISRAAGADKTTIESTQLTVMASDIEALSFSYYNVLNGVVQVGWAPSTLPCATELSDTACYPGVSGGGGGDESLLMIQRVKARVTARTSRPDWQYTDPEDPTGPNPNYRKRKAVLDLKARNVEDVTLQGGQIIVGSCGDLNHTIAVPGGTYGACKDRQSYELSLMPDQSGTTWYEDNPSLTIDARDKDGNPNTNTSMTVTVNARGIDGSSYYIYDEYGTISNLWRSDQVSETRYLAAHDQSNVTDGAVIELTFSYSDGICTQVKYDGDVPITLDADSSSSHFVSTAGSMVGVSYVTASTMAVLSIPPDELMACRQAADMGAIVSMRLQDDCGNGITGQTVTWSDNGAGGAFTAQTDAGNGDYTALYLPPDNLSAVVSQQTVALDVTWNAETHSETVTLIPAQPHDIVIDSIVEVAHSGDYQFSSTPAPDNGSTFRMERVDGQLVKVTFHFEDACGNRVYDVDASVDAPTAGQVSSILPEGNGIYAFNWYSDIGCGAGQTGHTITIRSADIADPSTATETVTYDLLETTTGPRLVLGVSAPGALVAGNTSDAVTIDARVEEYNESLELCTNMPGPFSVAFEVTGDAAGRSGSFSGSDHEQTTTSITTAADGTGSVELHPGTAQWDDNLTVTATADVGGADYSNSAGVGMLPSDPDLTFSGYFPDSSYLVANKVGITEADRAYTPGETIYIQVKDFDENESPLAQNSMSAPWTSVRLSVERTGDVETVLLTEHLTNTALFRGSIDTQHAAVALSGDGVLQVLHGDRVTMDYEDKDDPAEFESWEAYTSGPRSMTLYRYEAGVYTELFSGGVQVVPVSYEDDIHVELYYPEFDSDGAAGAGTDVCLVSSGSDDDTLQMREYLDTGILEIDNGAGLFRVTKSDPSDLADQLGIDSTPRSVTVGWPDLLTPAVEQTFRMYDQDVPTVTIDSPADGSSVAGSVIIAVNASDPFNTTPSGGISKIEVYINGRYFGELNGADLSGTQTFDWTTVIPVDQPTWLDGTHQITARVWDTAGNSALSAPVTVELDNNLYPIEFTAPTYASVWGSTDIYAEVSVANLAAEGGTFQVYLSVDGGIALLLPNVGGTNYGTTLDGRSMEEGTRTLIATVQDLQGNYQWTALDIDIDRTPPEFYSWWNDPANEWKPWLNYWWVNPPWYFWFDFEAADLHGFADSSSVALVTVSGVPNGYTDQPAQWWGSWSDGWMNHSSYGTTWSAPAAGYVGSVTFTATAWDTSTPANMGTFSVVFNVDTKPPTMDAPKVAPAVLGSLLSGTVTVSTRLYDDYPQFVHLEIYNPLTFDWVVDNGWMWDTWPVPIKNVDALGGFSYNWNTAAVPDGPYLLRMGGWDRAENEVIDWWMDEYIYYVDNSRPTVWTPYVAKPNNIVDGRINVRYYATDPFGIIKAVAIVVMKDGQHPQDGYTPLSTEVLALPFDTANTTVTGTLAVDVSALFTGDYDVYCMAEDWAGNQSTWSGLYNLSLDRSYLLDAWGYYSRTGINYDVAVGGTLYDSGLPAVGSTMRLYYGVRPSGVSTYTYTNIYVATDPAGAYSNEYLLNLNPGDYFFCYHYSPQNNMVAYNSATVPNAVVSNFTSYGPLGMQVRNPEAVGVDELGLGYSLGISGVLWNDAGPMPLRTVRVRLNLYDDLGTYTGYLEYLATTGGDGSFTLSTYPDIFPAGQRMYVYIYDQATGKQLGYFQGYSVQYTVPGPLLPYF